jgi:hypothetical protein
MKFNLPINVQSEVKQYDPEVRAMVELQKELEAAKKGPSKPRKPREYRRGNPAQLVPHELFHDDPMEALHLYQQAVKDISDDTDGRAGHAIVRRLINSDNEMFGIMYYFRYLWVAAWIPEAEEDGTRPYVYGISVAFKDNATTRSTVPASFFARNCTARNTAAPVVYMFNQDDMISYTVGRTKYKTKTIIITEDDIKEGYRDEFWLAPSQLHKWNFNHYSSKTRDLCHVLRRFSERVGETIKREEHDNSRNLFDRIYHGDPTLAKCVAGSYSPVAFLNRRNIDCYRNEVDWYIKQILDVTYVGDMGEPKEKFTAYFDIATFHMNYNDMVEYSYGLWGDSNRLNPLGVGFKPINVGQTKISGLDCSILTDGDLGSDWKISSRLSYTYMIPKTVNPDLVYDNYNDRLDDLLQNFLNEGLIDETLLPLIQEITAQDSELSFNSTSSNPEARARTPSRTSSHKTAQARPPTVSSVSQSSNRPLLSPMATS